MESGQKRRRLLQEGGFDFEVASEIFLDPPYIEREDTREDYGEPRFVATGIVADVGIITAWRASKSEKDEYYANCAGFQGADPPPWRSG